MKDIKEMTKSELRELIKDTHPDLNPTGEFNYLKFQDIMEEYRKRETIEEVVKKITWLREERRKNGKII
jgi:hypothetical protein